MTSKLARSLVIPAASILSLATASAQVNLTDMVAFGADATGSFAGQPDVTDTRPNGNFINWIQNGASGGAFLNGPTDTAAQPNISLSLGVHSFRILSAPGIDNPNFGINLFFNGSQYPSISAFGPMLTSAQQPHIFAADGAAVTPQAFPPNGNLPGAGTLSFVSGNELVTLTDFYWATPSVYGLDLTGQFSTGADGQLDYVGGITLNVTAVPEPQAPALLLIYSFFCLVGMQVFSSHRPALKR